MWPNLPLFLPLTGKQPVQTGKAVQQILAPHGKTDLRSPTQGPGKASHPGGWETSDKGKNQRFGSIPSQEAPPLLSQDIFGLGSFLTTLDKRERSDALRNVSKAMFTFGGKSLPNIVLGGLSQSFLKSVKRFLLTLVLFGLLVHIKRGAIWPWLLLGK